MKTSSSSSLVITHDTDNLSSAFISDVSSKIDKSTKIIYFPKSQQQLSSKEYELFFSQLQKKLSRFDLRLNRLVLSACTNDALDGLIAYCQLAVVFDVKSIEIHMDETLDISLLQTLLSKLNDYYVMDIIFVDKDNRFSLDDWTAVSEIITRDAIAFSITLPDAFYQQPIQRIIDESTSNHRILKNQAHLSREKKINPASLRHSLPKRSRPKSNNHQLMTDIDLQQDVQVEMLIEQQIEQEIPDVYDYVIKGLSFRELIAYVTNTDTLNTDAKLLTESMLEDLWDVWAGTINLESSRYKNSSYQTISEAAAQQLLQHRHLFYAGLNADSLPQGFVLVADKSLLSSTQYVLHYDDNQLQDDEMIAPVLIERPSITPLSNALCEQLIQALNNERITSSWNAMKEGAYHRLYTEAFRRYLPLLVDLNPDLLIQILDFADNDQTGQLLSYIMDNYRQIHAIFKNETFAGSVADNSHIHNTYDFFEVKGDMIIAILLQTFSTKENIINVLNIAKSLTENQPQRHCLLLKLLKDTDEDLHQQAIHWQETLGLDYQQTQAMLQVYVEYGDVGLMQLFALWERVHLSHSDVLQHLFDTIFKTANTFVPMIHDDKIAKAIDLIVAFTSLDANQGLWWSFLLEQHATAVGYDDLPALVDGFVVFVKKITAIDLRFYSNPAFSDIKNMPTVLHRIIDLLNHCNTADRQLQWECLTGLDWQSNGAIRALIDSKTLSDNPYRFITPDMRMTPKYYYEPSDDPAKGYLPSSKLSWIHEPQNKSPRMTGGDEVLRVVCQVFGLDSQQEDCLDTVRMHYYRYVAAQKHRLPLSFYQTMDKAIQDSDFIKLEKASLYTMMASTTTGEINGHSSVNPQDDIQNGLNILTKLASISLPTSAMRPWIRSLFLEPKAFGYKSLVTFGQTILLLEHVLTFESVRFKKVLVNIDNKLTRMLCARKLEHAVILEYGFAYEKSNHFYTPASLDNAVDEPLYFKHIDVLLVFIEQVPHQLQHYIKRYRRNSPMINDGSKFDNNPLPDKTIAQLISLIGLFGLAYDSKANNKKTAYKIHALVAKALEKSEAITTALDFLTAINKEHAKPLTPKHLIDFIKLFTSDKAASLTEAGIVSIVKQRFNNCFQDDFFDNLTAKKLQADVCDFIDKTFPDKADSDAVKKLLIAFPTSSDSLHYLAMCKKIHCIVRDLSSQQRQHVLAQLSLPMLIANLSAETFLAYLEPIKTITDLNECLYIIQKANAMSMDANSEILQRIQIYLKSLWPDISRLLSPIIPKVELRNLVIHLLFSLESLSVKEHEVLSSEAYTQLIEALSDGQSDESLGQAIDTFFRESSPINYPLLRQLRADLTLSTGSSSSNDVARSERYQYVQENKRILIDNARDELIQAKACNTCEALFVDVFKTIHELVSYYENDKLLLTQYLNYFLTHDNKPQSQLMFASESINLIAQEYITLNDSDMIRSLCVHFSMPTGHYTHKNLLRVMNNSDYQELSLDNKRVMLGLLTSLLDNNKQSSLDDFQTLLTYCAKKTTSQILIDAIARCYQTAPFPELTILLFWLNDSENLPNDARVAYLDDCYITFDKEPALREKHNGFDINIAVRQAKKIQGIDYHLEDLVTIAYEIQEVRKLATKAISDELNSLRDGLLEMSDEHLLALAAELLYRTKAGFGSSFEINTTQYLAIHSMLKSGEHVTSQIGTGEGKSRIMMIMIACQYARGKTIDFITSNMQLATRDYLAFRALFQALGAKTRLIHQYSLVKDYALDGIHFSDLANINLFRNKAYSEGNNDLVIHSVPKQRALMLDEADRAFFDLSDTRFNYSAAANDVIRGMPWIYDLLIRFFSQDNPAIMTQYHDNIDECTNLFMGYAQLQLKKTQYQRLLGVSIEQLEAWQASAVMALRLNIDEHFIIKSPVDSHTAQGPKQVSDAWLLVGKRQDPHSRYSYGVHQCLHARLNLLNKDKLLPMVYEDDFFVDNEKQIIYSSTSQSMLNEYRSGTLIAVTGTAGTVREQNEVRNWYPDEENSLHKMAFLSVPRHLGLQRHDHPIYLTADTSKQYRQILQYILKAQTSQQPCLIICENDADSKAIEAYLQTDLPSKLRQNLTRIDAETSSDVEEAHIKNTAGKPSKITVSTDMIGRGTDIVLHGRAKNAGLTVLLTYLPESSRSMQQILGRSGRLGAKGDTHIILNKETLKKQLGKTSLNDGCYTATEAYITHQQMVLERGASRIVTNAVGAFITALQVAYYQACQQISDIDKKALSPLWQAFRDETDKQWREIWPHIEQELIKHTPNFVSVNQQLKAYQHVVQRSWHPLTQQALLLPKDVGVLELTDNQIDSLKKDSLSATPLLKTSIYEHYDPAHDGKAALYSRKFEQTRAFFKGERPLLANFRAWWSGRGILFPNLRAWWAGNMSFKQLILGDNLTVSQVTTPSSYALMSHVNTNQSEVDGLAHEPVHSDLFKPAPITNDSLPQNLPTIPSGGIRLS